MKNFTRLVLIFVAICLSSSLVAQSPFVPLSNMHDDWTFSTNAGDNQTIEVVSTSSVPAGIGVNTDKVFKHVSYDIDWGGENWWWSGYINFNTPVNITVETKTLKFKIYSNDLATYRTLIKNSTGGEILFLEHVPVSPEQWTTYEIDLSHLVGENIKEILLMPEGRNRLVYVFPYFEDPTPKPALTPIGALKPDMTTDDFDFGDNHAGTAFSVVDAAGLNVPDAFATKVFKVTADNDPGREFWWSAILGLKEAQVVPEDENTVLVAKVLSPNDRILLNLVAEDATKLSTNFNYGTRKIVPNQWTEIVLDFVSPDRGWTFLKFIELSPFVNTDLHVYFYWATKSSTGLKEIVPVQNNISLVGELIVVDGAKSIKQYNAVGQLLDSNNTGTIPAIKGLNIIVADGVSYKVMYSGK